MRDANRLEDYARADFVCSCGQRHKTDINRIVLGTGLVSHLAGLARELAGNQARILLAADQNTWQAAGLAIHDGLRQAGIDSRQLVFPARPALVADEKAVFTLLNAMEPDVCLLVAVGSGTINDLTRFVSHRTGRPYAIAATAPSMDGYASSVAALTISHIKQTVPARGADLILADPRVLAACPQAMIAAGLGDVLGKYTAICDWRLGGLVTAEHQCGSVSELVLSIAEECRREAGALAQRDEAAVTGLFAALVMSGIAMSYMGNSRPASGSEHHLSHFWEIALLRAGLAPVLHGSKVGLATLIACDLYRKLPELQPDFVRAREQARQFDRMAWEAEMKAAYAEGADVIIRLEQESGRHDPQNTLGRLAAIEQNWEQICSMAKQTVPDASLIRAALLTAGGPASLAELGISRDLAAASLRHAIEMRDRYTVLCLYADLGLTEQAISRLDSLFSSPAGQQ